MRLLPLALVVLVTACTSGDPAPRGADTDRSPEPSAPVEQIEGVVVLDRGVVAWENGVELDDPHVLRVMAEGVSGPPDRCTDAVVVRAVQQSGAEVVLEARRYGLPDVPADQICTSIGQAPRPHEVRLDQPLAGRRVVDASTGQAREVIAFDDFPDVQQVPAGYEWRPPTWDDQRRVVTRTWGSREGSLSLEIGPGRQLQSLPAVLREGRVGDQPVTVTRVIMLSCARWGPPERTLNLCSRDAGAGDPPLDPDELLAVAASVG